MYFIGIDLGTSSLKGLLIDKEGKILKKETIEYNVYSPKYGYSEQNPKDWLNAATEVLARLSKGNENEVKGISISGQMHGLVILDKNDQVIRPCILWNDGRSINETNYLNNDIGADFLLENTGNIAFPGFTLPKLLWVKANEPENFKRINKIMLPKDYLIYMLTGEFVSDYSDQSGTLFLDCKNKKYSQKMLEIAEIDENMLPRLEESFAIVGNIKPEFNLPNCLLAPGGGDNACAAIGTGCIFENTAMISLGTSGTIFIPSDEYKLVPNGSLHSFNHANGKNHVMGCILSASSCNKWWVNNILEDNDFENFNIEESKLGENHVLFAPYLTGERAPYNDVLVRGSFLNLSNTTKRKDMSQAILEGVAYAFKDCMNIALDLGISIKEIRVSGGGSKNEWMKQILANVLNVNIITLQTEEGPSFGAAILAMVACGVYKTLESAINKIIKIERIIKPNHLLVEKYLKGYQKYHKIYSLLREIE